MKDMPKLITGARELGLELNSRQLEQFELYYQELVAWSRRVNLTAITDRDEVQTKHFLDSLTVTLAGKRPPPEGLNFIDVGTGAGLPGIPLKITFPGIRLTLLEATAKKTTFLRYVTHRLGLDDIEIVIGRAETAAHQPQYREQFDIVLSRAVARLATLAELTLPFCKMGGSFIAQKKGVIDKEVKETVKAFKTLGGSLREVKRVALEGLTDGRCLIVIDKIAPTPDKYPRRPGVPAKRPIM